MCVRSWRLSVACALLALCAACGGETHRSNVPAGGVGGAGGADANAGGAASSTDPHTTGGAGGAPAVPAAKLCDRPSSGVPFLPTPHPSCDGKACATDCDPCSGSANCSAPTGKTFACDWMLNCVEVRP
ncbi:MAG: hypothetical protein ACOY0T_13620 [Myxococcota bacterium]